MPVLGDIGRILSAGSSLPLYCRGTMYPASSCSTTLPDGTAGSQIYVSVISCQYSINVSNSLSTNIQSICQYHVSQSMPNQLINGVLSCRPSVGVRWKLFFPPSCFFFTLFFLRKFIPNFSLDGENNSRSVYCIYYGILQTFWNLCVNKMLKGFN